MTKILFIRRPENDTFIDLYVIFKISLGTSTEIYESPSINTNIQYHLFAL